MFFISLIALVVLLVMHSRLSARVEELEKRLGIPTKAPTQPQQPVAPMTPPPADSFRPLQPTQAPVHAQQTVAASIVDVFAEDVPQKPQVFAQSQPVQAVQQQVEARTKKPSKSDNLEFKFGSQIFTGLGALAVIAGIAFFLKYAFQTGLINETMRVILGVVLGLIFIGVGYALNKKYPQYGQTLVGTGLGLLYLSVFSSYNFYHFVSFGMALVLMLAVTALGIVLALVLDSMLLAIFASLGGFLTPFLVSGVQGEALPLFAYILALDIGIVVIAFYRLWRPLILGSFAASIIVFMTWMGQSYNNSLWLTAEVFLGCIFVLFLAVSFIHYLRQTAPEDEYDLGLILLNALVFYCFSFVLISTYHRDFMGIFTVLMGLLYVVLWLVVRKQGGRDIRFRSFLAGVGFVLFALAVPVQFEKFVITIAWAAEALVLAYLGIKIRSRALKNGAHLLFMFVFLRLLFLDSQIDVTTAFLNTRFVAVAFSLVAFAAAYWLMSQDTDDTQGSSTSLNLMMGQMAIIFVGGISLDIHTFYSPLALTYFWILAVVVLGFVGFSIKNVVARVLSFFVLFGILCRLIVMHSDISSTATPFINSRFVIFLAVIGISALMSLMYRNSSSDVKERTGARNILLVEMYILAQVLFTLEINDFFSSSWLTVVWSLIGLGAFAFSLAIQNKMLRVVVYVTYIVAILRALFFDAIMSVSEYTPVFNGRVLAFLSIIAALFISAYLLYRDQSEDTHEEKKSLVAVMSIAANILFIILISFEVLGYFNVRMIGESASQAQTLENIKRVMLSLAWIVYALVLIGIGITHKSARARIMAIVLIIITVFKVFLYDTAEINNFYRFISWISLGAILLLTGFLYNKYKTRILQFIKTDASQENV